VDYLKTSQIGIAFIIPILLSGRLVDAQASIQGILNRVAPVSRQINSGNQHSWTFNGLEGEVVSISAVATTGDLDPTISLSNSGGEIIIGNDDYAYPDQRDALLEAITLPRTDAYTLTVSGINGTAGEYRLTLLPGFVDLQQNENFNGDVTWRDDGISISIFRLGNEDGALTLALEGPDDNGLASNPQQLPLTDYYADVLVKVLSGQDGWIVSLTARQQDNRNFYSLNINNQGEWRFRVRQAGEDRILRDWTAHPLLVSGVTDFRLGMMVNGGGFDFFYNGQLFGRLTDFSLPEAGRVGLGVGTVSSLTSQAQVAFDDLTITTPLLTEGQRILPQQLIIGSPAATARDLQRRGLVPGQGELMLNVGESFVESQRPGVEELLLARGSNFRTFALGSSVSWQATEAETNGCGLVFHTQDDTNYTLAYIDQSGGYGVSQRINERFLPGIFGENLELAGNQHHLLVIVQTDRLLYYVDGVYAGSSATEGIEGGVGNAVINIDAVRTSCQFSDTWVWSWDN
jgi:hypothetical protein